MLSNIKPLDIYNNRTGLFKERVRFGFISAGILIAAGTLYFASPDKSGLFPPCPFHAITGLFCPGCGTLRGLHKLLHGNVIAAMGLNPLMVMSLPYLGYAYLSLCSKALKGKPLPTAFIPAKWLWSLLVIIIIYALARNIPVYPFDLLAP